MVESGARFGADWAISRYENAAENSGRFASVVAPGTLKDESLVKCDRALGLISAQVDG